MSTSILEAQPIERVEPPHWWVGMENPNLQIMVYGENIASCEISVNQPGIDLESIQTVSNPNYSFLNLRLTESLKPSSFDIVFEKNGERWLHPYRLAQKRTELPNELSINPSDVIYLITPDRFANGDVGNDSTDDTLEKYDRGNPDGRHGGDIKGISDHIEYIKDLGATTIWLNPFQENDQSAYSYHGYAISDFYRTDPRLGSNDEYVRLVSKCHDNNMKVMMDMVFNHCGSGHWWMNDLPSEDWIMQWEEFTPTNYVTKMASDPYASDSDFNKMTRGWFDTNMPDLNLENEILRTYMIQNSLWWIEYAKIDGIRMDTYAFNEQGAMAYWMQRIEKEYPNFYVVAETLEKKPSYLSYWVGKKHRDGYRSNLKSVSDYPLYYAMLGAFGKDGDVTGIYETLAEDFIYGNPYLLKTFNGNHDLSRLYALLDHNMEKVKLSLAFLLTTRGIPQIYYGDELLMKNRKPDGELRQDFPGGWAGDKRNAFESSGQTSEEKEMATFLKKILRWRRGAKAVHKGKLTHYVPRDNVYVYFREEESRKVMVIINNSNRDLQEFAFDRFEESLEGYSKGQDILTDLSFSLNAPISIGANKALIVELEQ